MAVNAVIPVKGLGTAKKRLSPVLSPLERRQLTLAMLANVLSAVQVPVVGRIVVVSNDLRVKNMAVKFSAHYIEQKTKGLNAALEEAIEWCKEGGTEAILVLPADIPLLSPLDVERIIKLGSNGEQTIVLSPSHDGGTSAVFQSSPNLVSMSFGPYSLGRHIRRARRAGVRVKLYYSKNLALDIDTAEDLATLRNVPDNTGFWEVLRETRLDTHLQELLGGEN